MRLMRRTIRICLGHLLVTSGWFWGTTVHAKSQVAQHPAPPPPIELIWMAGPPSSAEPRGKKPQATRKLRERGRALYEKHCMACHGQAGDGRGPAAQGLDYPPTDFTAGVFKLRSTPSGTLPTDEDLFVTLSRGMHGTAMFPWYRLPEPDRWALVYHIKSFSPRFRSERPGPTLFVPRAPIETEERVARGAQLYESLRCNTCHGPEGGGDGLSVDLYTGGRAGKPVRVRDFQKGMFLRGRELEDIYRTLITGLDGTPMGPYDSLAPADLWALSAYVRDLVRAIPAPEIPRGWKRKAALPADASRVIAGR